jgi:hypothetical protein
MAPPRADRDHPIFGRTVTVPTLVREIEDGKVRLSVNIRSYPGMSGEVLKSHLVARVRDFNERTGSALQAGGDSIRSHSSSIPSPRS